MNERYSFFWFFRSDSSREFSFPFPFSLLHPFHTAKKVKEKHFTLYSSLYNNIFSRMDFDEKKGKKVWGIPIGNKKRKLGKNQSLRTLYRVLRFYLLKAHFVILEIFRHENPSISPPLIRYRYHPNNACAYYSYLCLFSFLIF